MKKFPKYLPLIITTFIFLLMLFGPLYLVKTYYDKEPLPLTPSFTETLPTSSPTGNYVCPPSGWVNCMPGPGNEGVRLECTEEFQKWAEANCPDYQGVAY